MKTKSTLIILMIFLSVSACDKNVLDVDPPGFPSAEGFYKSADDVGYGINGIYQTFQGDIWGGAFVHIQPHFEAATEDAVICCDWEYGIYYIARGAMSPTTGGFISWKWDFGYEAINRSNLLLAVMEDEGLSG